MAADAPFLPEHKSKNAKFKKTGVMQSSALWWDREQSEAFGRTGGGVTEKSDERAENAQIKKKKN